MDPITAAGSFATIVGLVSNFKAERRASSDNEYREFLEWLDTKHHSETLRAIQANQSLSNSIDTLLKQNHEQVISKLAALDDSLLLLASKMPDFRNISLAIAPSAEISDQAVSALRQLERSGGSKFLETKLMQRSLYLILDASGQIEMEDPRFADDDLDTLCSLGLLIPSANGKGERVFTLTRASVRFLEQVDNSL